jgi:hypothetical protein
MESISGVEREIDKVLSKFTGINEHADRVLQDLARSIESLKNELDIGKLQIVTQVTASKWVSRKVMLIVCSINFTLPHLSLNAIVLRRKIRSITII